MLNPATEQLVISNHTTSYTKLYAQHNFYLDDDVVSKVVFYATGGSEQIVHLPASQKLYTFFVLEGLAANAAYSINAAFYDAMASDPSLVDNKIGINLSNTLFATTAQYPSITGITVTATAVDIGVADPTVNFTFAGAAENIVLQSKKVGSLDWVTVYEGAFRTSLSLILPVGNYNFRMLGKIALPDGMTIDVSPYNTYASVVNVAYLALPPSTPTNIVFAAAKIKDGIERYDVRASWTWNKGAGASSKEFIFQYVASSEYASTGWSKAITVNTASAHSALISSFPFGKEYTFRVGVTSWGQETVWSSLATYIINSSTVFNQDITTVSGCEIGYYGIKAYALDNSTYKQSFYLDAATGAVSIGLLDGLGKAPFTFDTTTKTLNVDGKVITKDINAANFILTNLGTGAPKLYSQEKPAYDNPNAGIFIGRNGLGKMQFDLGNSSSYVKFDGDNLRLSPDVVIGLPGGDVPISSVARGAGIYALAVTNLSAWSDVTANNFFLNNYNSAPLKYDTLTMYNSAHPTTAFTKMWDGAGWVTPGLTVNGNMIVDGTVRAQSLVAGDAFFAQAGIDRIYDKTAALSADPETNYKMKVDLANGLIHIR